MKHLLPLLVLSLPGCTPEAPADDPVPDRSSGAPGDASEVTDADGAVVFREPGARPAPLGPGGPAVPFTEDDLNHNCAFLPGDAADLDHHNLVTTYRGHLILPWAPEFGLHGGISVWDVSDPCDPFKVGEGTSPTMRETHAMGFVHLPEGDPNAGDWAVTNGLEGLQSGVQFWDMSDPTLPVAVGNLALEGSLYPDSYNLVTLSVFWQYPYVYTGSANAGVFVIDATDPRSPEVVGHYTFDQGLRVGGIFALGHRLLVTSAEEEQAAILDISDPTAPQAIPGGLFTVTDGDGEPREAYFANLSGHWALFARKEEAGGPIIYDISDPENPTFVADLPLPGSGGYVFYDEGFLFTGDSGSGHIIDARDMNNLTLLATAELDGDLDTLTPYGNVAIVAVDDPGDDLPDGHSSAVMPWATEVDTKGPAVLGVEPQDGATGVRTTVRIGIGFDEYIDPASVFAGSVRLWHEDGTPVPGWGSGQEAIASFTPKVPLDPGTTYTVEVWSDGIIDINGNAVEETTTWTFTTAQ